MTRTSTIEQDYAWHREAMAGKNPAVHESKPQCGWYETKLVKNGPLVPAVIWVDEYEGQQSVYCRIGNDLQDVSRHWPYLAKRPISFEKYQYMKAKGAWAQVHSQDHPAANPHMPIDLDAAKPPF